MPADSLQRVVDQVFARPEYRWVRGRHPLEWLREAWQALHAWLEAFQEANPTLYTVVLVALVVALAGLLGHIVWVVWRIVRPTTRTGSPAAAATGGPRFADARAHLEHAEALARDGRYAEALAHRFLAVVLQLERARALTFHPSKTPAEYAAEARLDPAGRESLGALVGRLYRHLFGAVPCDAETYRDFGAAAQVVLRHVGPA